MDNNTYLDADAMLTRMRNMETQSDTIKNTIDETKNIMEELKSNFEGFSSEQLNKEYQDVADTFDDFRQYLQNKIKDMETLTGNITQTDEN